MLTAETQPADNGLGGKSPVVLGMSYYRAEKRRDPVTRFFPPREDAGGSELRLLQQAVEELGYDTFDSAQMYGDSEVIAGDLVRLYPNKELVVVTKIGAFPTETPMEDIERSVARVKTTPHMMIHDNWLEMKTVDKTFEALQQALRNGLIRGIGVSNYNMDNLELALKVFGKDLTSYQAKINLDNPRKDALQTLLFCEENGIVFMGSAANNNGEKNEETAKYVDPIVERLTEKYGASKTELSIRAAVGVGVLPVIQSKTPDNMRKNIAAPFIELEPSDEMALTDLIYRRYAMVDAPQL